MIHPQLSARFLHINMGTSYKICFYLGVCNYERGFLLIKNSCFNIVQSTEFCAYNLIASTVCLLLFSNHISYTNFAFSPVPFISYFPSDNNVSYFKKKLVMTLVTTLLGNFKCLWGFIVLKKL